MLKPLDSRKLRALVCDEEKVDCYSIRAAKNFFAENEVLEGVRNLLQAFGEWRPHLYHDHKNRERWHIQFPDPLFDTLYLRANGISVEIFKHRSYVTSAEIREVFKHKKCSASIEMVGCPQNWVLMLQWLWAYGDEVYIINVKKGYMLRTLDYRKLDTLAEDDNDADCDSIRHTKACLGEEKDIGRGIVYLFEGWEVFAPLIHRDKEVEDSWHVTFRDSPFRSLRIQPSIDHGVVDVYAFDKYVNSFHVLDNPKNPDRDTWRRLLTFVWDYGKRRQERKKRWEEMQRLSPKKYTKILAKSKRTEKPLLHKVLHTAGFKAQRGAIPRANNMRFLPDKEDDVMEDIDTGVRAEKSLSRQLFNQKSPLRATNPNALLGTSQKANDTEGNQTTTKVEIDEANIGGLEIMDCQT
ncbi:MAG: hypothetical protein Q9175_004260 [Cornicularia normoerica]